MKTRPIWWQCSLEHEGCVDGHVVNSRERTARLLLRIQTQHAKRFLSCAAELIRVGATKRGIRDNKGCITFKVEKAHRPAA